MKRTTIVLVLLLVLGLLVSAGTALAATTATVTVNATPSYVAITNSPNTYDFGVIATSSTGSTGETYFTVVNAGTVEINTTIEGNGWSATGSAWTYGAPGENTGNLTASNGAGGYVISVPNGSPLALHAAISASANETWGLQLNAPTSFTHGDEQSTTVTITGIAN